MREKLTVFQDGVISYVESVDVKDGVVCDVYRFDDDNTTDLAVVGVSGGSKTPLQRILDGEKTIEGYVSGSGELTVIHPDGETKKYVFPGNEQTEVSVDIGDTMQWESTDNLVFYELCTPPYADGRFQDVDEDEL